MRCPRSVAAAGLLPAALMVLSGCAVVDQYSGRAVSYNLEAEQALEQGLLLNIVRASQRRPMQFTSVASISGTASSSSNAGITIPFGAGGASYKNGSFGTTISGGPTFSVPVLDTQEFYQGVMTPVSGQLFDFFLNEEYPREELFTLFVEKIVIHRDTCDAAKHTTDCELVFVNYPGSDLQFDLTQSMIEHLLNLGLMTEPEKAQGGAKSAAGSATASTGAAPASPEYRFCFTLRNGRYATHIIDSTEYCGYEGPPKKASTPTDKTTATIDKKIQDGSGAVLKHIQGTTTTVAPKATSPDPTGGKKKTVAGLVLSHDFIKKLKMIANETVPTDRNREYYEFIKNIDSFEGLDAFGRRVVKQQIVKSAAKKDAKPSAKVVNKVNAVTLSIYTRSTEGVLYFLGEVVRHELYPDNSIQPGQVHRILKIKVENTSYREFPELPCEFLNNMPPFDEQSPQAGEVRTLPVNFTCKNLFVLDEGPPIPSLFETSVMYRGAQYSVPDDIDRQGKTLHVLSIVKQLMAVNMSAKSLPQTNLISVVSP